MDNENVLVRHFSTSLFLHAATQSLPTYYRKSIFRSWTSERLLEGEEAINRKKYNYARLTQERRKRNENRRLVRSVKKVFLFSCSMSENKVFIQFEFINYFVYACGIFSLSFSPLQTCMCYSNGEEETKEIKIQFSYLLSPLPPSLALAALLLNSL